MGGAVPTPVPTEIPVPTPTAISAAESAVMPVWLLWLIIAAAIAVMVGFAFIPAVMAKKKGYSYGGFWVFGFFLFIPAIIVAAVIGDKRGVVYPPNMQPGQYAQPYSQPGTCFCPNCGALMPNDSTFCPTCGARVG